MTLKEIIERSHEPGYVALDSLKAAGFVIVPREPTYGMLSDTLTCWDVYPMESMRKVWREMIEAFERTTRT